MDKLSHRGRSDMAKQIFVHIPKTAGTFVRHALAAKYGNVATSYPSPPFKRIKDMTDDELDVFRQSEIYIGHEYLSDFEKALPYADNDYYSIIRNPVDRLISYYNHAMRLFSQFKNNKVTLLKFMENRKNIELCNLQVRYLSGAGHETKLAQNHLDDAIRNIESGKISVGLQENLDAAFRDLKILHGISVSDGRKQINESVGGISRADISEIERLELRDANILDFKLYEYCLQR